MERLVVMKYQWLALLVPAFTASTLSLRTPAASMFRAKLTPSGTADIEALSLLMAFDAHERHAARLASRHRVGAAIAAYARMIDREHEADEFHADDVACAAGVPLDADAGCLPELDDWRRRCDRLDALDGRAFEDAWLGEMLDEYQALLIRIDQELLPRVQNPLVLRHLELARARIAAHLDEARRLRAPPMATRPLPRIAMNA
jgi:predicted outer membrane protein